MKFSIVDMGTNSVRFDIYDFNRKGAKVELLYREKQMIRLGQGLFETGRFHPQAKQRALEAFENFHGLLLSNEINRVRAFATSAMRFAADSQELLQLIKAATGIDVLVIDGKTEAELIAKGVLYNEALPKKPFVLVDIGGGSTEVCFCSGKELIEGVSFPLGASRLNQMFLQNSPQHLRTARENSLEALRKHIRETMYPTFKKMSFPKPKVMLGSSGTILSICKILKQNGENADPFQKHSVDKTVEKMAFLTPEELCDIAGMEEKRLDIIVAGSILLDEIMAILEVYKLRTTKFALRDGILLQELQGLLKQANPILAL